ncbi:MAG: radical SAM protein [Candidatus Marinimicrobia bacterium]|nr:radical SAM protein [Candidatus Neomarinimicrobiota bacterium]|tara:strand:- start:41 stop:1123 length:1083 start_codon:yes stop_codon:yes gene_type:complete
MDKKKILLELQSFGARIDAPLSDPGRCGGAGPSDDKAFLLDGVPAMVPTLGGFAQESPYLVTRNKDGKYAVTQNGNNVMPVEFVSSPKFYELKTKDGIPYKKIAVLHSTDVLATTVSQRCIRWRREGERCQFCAIENSLDNDLTISLKTPEQLAEVAEAAVRLDGVKHMIMTTGTMNYRDMGVHYLVECTRALKEKAPNLGIQVQFEPPEDLEDMKYLYEAGVDAVGIHLESFNQEIREKITPGKAQISIDRYFESFKYAVGIFGRNQVSTYIIVGLGDTEDSIVEGCRQVAELGVYPFVVPLRPIMGTPLENVQAPDPKLMEQIYLRVAKNNREFDLAYRNSKAGCARCGACSGIAAFE